MRDQKRGIGEAMDRLVNEGFQKIPALLGRPADASPAEPGHERLQRNEFHDRGELPLLFREWAKLFFQPRKKVPLYAISKVGEGAHIYLAFVGGNLLDEIACPFHFFK